MITINETGNYDVTDNHPDEVDTPIFTSEQEMFAYRLNELRRILSQPDRRANRNG